MPKNDASKKEEKKLRSKSVNELFDNLVKYPLNSSHYNKILKIIQKKIESTYNGQYILAVEREYLAKYLNTYNGLIEVGSLYEFVNDLKLNEFLNESNPSQFKSRSLIEYDLNYKQIITTGYLKFNIDGEEEIVLLKKKCNNKLSLIGGHLDFTELAYIKSIDQIFMYNMIKELLEEVRLTIALKGSQDIVRKISLNDIERLFNFKVKFIINNNDSLYSLRNIGVIYEISPKSEVVWYGCETNEPENHTVVTRKSFKDIQKSDERCSPWLADVAKYLSVTVKYEYESDKEDTLVTIK